jgi:hypothetical protein
MQQELQAMPGRRGSRHGLGSSTIAADRYQHHRDELDEQQDQQRPSFSSQLPLMPLDLSECERLVPVSSGITPRRMRRGQQQQQQPTDNFTSPRSALDAAAAVVAGDAMQLLLTNRDMLGLTVTDQDAEGAQSSLPAAAGGLGSFSRADYRSSLGLAGAAAAVKEKHEAADGNEAGLSMMVPLGAPATAAVPLSTAGQGIYRRQHWRQQRQHVTSSSEDCLVQVQEDYLTDYDDSMQELNDAAAAAIEQGGDGSGGKRWNLRPHSKQKHYSEHQPSRRSRRIAGDTPEEAEAAHGSASAAAAAVTATAAAAAGGTASPKSTGTRSRRTLSRLTVQEIQELEGDDKCQLEQREDDDGQGGNADNHAAETDGGAQPEAEEDAVDGDASEAEAGEDEEQQQQQPGRVRGRGNGRRGRRGSKGKAGSSQQQQQQHTQQHPEDPSADAVAGLSQDAAMQQQQYLSALSGLQMLQPAGANLQQLQLQLASGLPFPAAVQVGAVADKHNGQLQSEFWTCQHLPRSAFIAFSDCCTAVVAYLP